MIYVQLFAGLVILAIGGELLVRGSVAIARHMRVSPLLIGLTLVGFGTSTPELVTSLAAALAGSSGISVGNVVGSNIANVLLILGIAALLRPVDTPMASFARDGGMMIASAGACTAVVLFGFLDRTIGAIFLALLAAYLVYCYVQERGAPAPSTRDETLIAPWLAGAFAIAGLALLIFGAEMLVNAAIELARHIGVSETVVGLTIVAVGTSLPEMMTSVIAAVRKQSDIAIGNIIGSNIFNVLGILGVTAVVKPIPVPREIAAFDIWVMLAATALLLFLAATNRRVSRVEGAIMLAGYVAYVGYLVKLS